MERPSSQLEVESYQRPNGSRLEPHREFVAKLRKMGWPYQAMTERLREDCDVSISVSALHEFCKRRKIKKGTGETSITIAEVARSTTENAADTLKPAPPRKKKRFSYGDEDDKNPLETHSH